MARIETDDLARRTARAIVSDISIYNEEKVIQGIQQDDLFERLAEDIEKGRALYVGKVDEKLHGKNFYDRAVVDILIKSRGHIRSRVW